MPKVTDPANHAIKANNTWFWDMEGVLFHSSKVINGTQNGGNDIYPGNAKLAPIVTDNAVALGLAVSPATSNRYKVDRGQKL